MPSRPRVKRAAARSRAALARGVAVSVALGELACTAPAPPAPPPAPTAVASTTAAPKAAAPAPVPAPEPPPPAPDPSSALAPYSVTSGAFARRVLYTWTTNEQIEELLKTRVLLSRSESPQYGRSYYDTVMDARWLGGDKLASVLRAAAFQKARFAWPAAWATFLGWPGEKYGTQLIEVTLKPDAYIAMYRTSTAKWEVRDLSDAVIPEAQALKSPGRIAAVFFVHDGITAPPATATTRPSRGDGREAYREYVLCNESMIESWSIGTEPIAKELRTSADTMEAAAKYFRVNAPPPQRADRWNAHVALLVWPSIVPASGAKELFEAALAFPNPNYVIDPAALESLAKELRQLGQVAPATTHQPTLKFPGAKPVPIPPPPPPPPAWQKKWRGTY
jgi:hypothetical protein